MRPDSRALGGRCGQGERQCLAVVAGAQRVGRADVLGGRSSSPGRWRPGSSRRSSRTPRPPSASGSENVPFARWQWTADGSAMDSVASPAVEITFAVVVAEYVLSSPGVNAPKDAGAPSVSASVAGTVPPTPPAVSVQHDGSNGLLAGPSLQANCASCLMYCAVRGGDQPLCDIGVHGRADLGHVIGLRRVQQRQLRRRERHLMARDEAERGAGRGAVPGARRHLHVRRLVAAGHVAEGIEDRLVGRVDVDPGLARRRDAGARPALEVLQDRVERDVRREAAARALVAGGRPAA